MSHRARQLRDARLPDLAPAEGLDHGIESFVNLLRAWGVETYESCEGGPGHSYPEPAVRFFGSASEGFRALAVALQHALPVAALNRHWQVIDGEPTGPNWELTFTRKAESC